MMRQSLMKGVNLRLRAMEPEDIGYLYRWENDPSIWKVSNTLTPFSSYQISDFIRQAAGDIYQNRQLRLMIELHKGHSSPVPVGTIDLFDFEPHHRRAGIGIMIDEHFREKGYARESLRILIRYAFEVLQLHQLYANIEVSNKKSIALFENEGFVQCGLKKEWNRTGESWCDEYLYQLIA